MNKVLGMMLVMLSLTGLAAATVVQTNSVKDPNDIYNLYDAMTDDLINDGSAALASVDSTPWNGYLANNGSVTDGNFWSGQLDYWGGTWSLTYNLDTSSNTLGYAISTIDILGGWNDPKKIECTLAYKLIGDAEYTTLGTYLYEALGGMKINLSDSLGGDLLSGVSALRFTFQNADLIREIDVVGSAVPEPATLSLLAIGGVLAMFRRRK